MRKRRRRRINPAQACYLIIILVVVVYAVGIPYLQEILRTPVDVREGFSQPGLSLMEAIRDRAIQVFFAAWIFFFGAALGSFLNVVAFRLPRGESIVSHASRCPFCETPIEARDNIPVFGWLGLRGRCRACRLPISTRYPIVEAATGSVVLLLALVELLSGGANLPDPQPFRRPGLAFILFSPDWPLISLTLFHVLLACMLLVWRLMEIDRAQTPSGFVLFGWLAALSASAVHGSMHPVPWITTELIWLNGLPPPLVRLGTPLVGGITGAALGAIMGRLSFRSNPPRQVAENEKHARADEIRATATSDCSALDLDDEEPLPPIPNRAISPPLEHSDGWSVLTAFSVVGAVLGWQAVISVAAFASIGLTFLQLFGRRRPPRFTILLAAVLVHISAWRVLAGLSWWPGPSASLWGYLFAASIIATHGLFVRGPASPALPKEEALAAQKQEPPATTSDLATGGEADIEPSVDSNDSPSDSTTPSE